MRRGFVLGTKAYWLDWAFEGNCEIGLLTSLSDPEVIK